ncbi:MAG: hypothetical protein FJ004_01255 [Chloroflexi bacterium]|nr:hypothetical protein [Chloroflexota bacterium]
MKKFDRHAPKPFLQKFAVGAHVIPLKSIYRGELGIVVDFEKIGYRHRVYVVMFPDFAIRKFYSASLTKP